MTKWDTRFLALAEHVSQWSKDPSTKVGAVIADHDHRIVSLGYNGPPRGVYDHLDRLLDREIKLAMTIHAEENAVLFAERSVHGCTIYTWPLPPCASCAAKLIQVGLWRIVAPAPSPEHLERWGASLGLSRQLYAEAGVEFMEVPNG